jgi:hypothetical protein
LGRVRRREHRRAVHPAVRPAARPQHLRDLRGLLALQSGQPDRGGFRARGEICGHLLDRANSHAINDGIDGVERLKATDGPDLIIQGSSKLYPGLLERGLIDRMQIMTFPVVLGKGKRLFADGMASGALRLVDSKVSAKGVVFATYEPAGEVEVGSFATKPPSEAELARRERMRREG